MEEDIIIYQEFNGIHYNFCSENDLLNKERSGEVKTATVAGYLQGVPLINNLKSSNINVLECGIPILTAIHSSGDSKYYSVFVLPMSRDEFKEVTRVISSKRLLTKLRLILDNEEIPLDRQLETIIREMRDRSIKLIFDQFNKDDIVNLLSLIVFPRNKFMDNDRAEIDLFKEQHKELLARSSINDIQLLSLFNLCYVVFYELIRRLKNRENSAGKPFQFELNGADKYKIRISNGVVEIAVAIINKENLFKEFIVNSWEENRIPSKAAKNFVFSVLFSSFGKKPKASSPVKVDKNRHNRFFEALIVYSNYGKYYRIEHNFVAQRFIKAINGYGWLATIRFAVLFRKAVLLIKDAKNNFNTGKLTNIFKAIVECWPGLKEKTEHLLVLLAISRSFIPFTVIRQGAVKVLRAMTLATRFILEVKRILRRGGRVVILEDIFSNALKPQKENVLLNLFFILISDSEKVSFLWFVDWFIHNFINKSRQPLVLGNYKTLEKWNGIFEKAGFIIKKTVHLGLMELGSRNPVNRGLIVLEKPSSSPFGVLVALQDRQQLLHEQIIGLDAHRAMASPLPGLSEYSSNTSTSSSPMDWASRLNLKASDLIHMAGLQRRYRKLKSLSPEEQKAQQLVIGVNFLPSALLTKDQRKKLLGAEEYTNIAVDSANANTAKERVIVTFHPMDGGLGTSVVRETYLEATLNRPKDDPKTGRAKLGAKATDLYLTFKVDGKDLQGKVKEVQANISIAEIKLLRSIEDAGRYSSVIFQPLVNSDSAPSYQKLLDSVYLLDAIDETLSVKRTYRQVLEEKGIKLAYGDNNGVMLYQMDLPIIDIETGE
ncbi:MAG: hypothetical protein WC357_10060, partial [Candidatus Omnitrophota bacterium]